MNILGGNKKKIKKEQVLYIEILIYAYLCVYKYSLM